MLGVLLALLVAFGIAESLTGCGGQSRTAVSTTAPAPGAAKLVVEGKDQKAPGPVECSAREDVIDIKIGDPSNGIGATVTKGDSPVVNYVGVGMFEGISMGYLRGTDPKGKADATKHGNTYKITGVATGRNLTDLTNPGRVVSKSFDMTATCP
jgi:lipoprotein LpqH